MSDGGTYDDQRLRCLEGVDGDGPRGVSAKNMLAALLALFLALGVGVTSYLAGRASWREPIRSGSETLPEARQAPPTPPATLRQSTDRSPFEVDTPPPVARMLEAQSRREAVARQRVEKHSVVPATIQSGSPRARQFHPSRRVLVARRALVQPQRVPYASRVVQLGEYPDRRQAKAAHARLVKVYPYLKTLPRKITSVRPPSGSARAYHLLSIAYSPDHARILCQNLVAIGRGCAVLPEPW
jgi:hypothetical protein